MAENGLSCADVSLRNYTHPILPPQFNTLLTAILLWYTENSKNYNGDITWSTLQTPTWWIYPKGTPPNFSRNRSGVGIIVDFRHLSRHISETVQDRVQVAIGH